MRDGGKDRLYEYFKNLGYTFHICGSISEGNYKVYIQCEECNDVDKYEYFINRINTMIEGLGDPNYQGKLTFVKGYICGYNGGKLFTCDYNPSAYTTTPKKVAQGGSMGGEL